MKHFEETKALLNESSFFYIITTNMQGEYSYINDHYANVFSHIERNFQGKPYNITMHPDDVGICIEVAGKCFENADKLFPATIRKHNGKGGYIITQWEYKAMFDDNNMPAGIFCLGYDITKFVEEKEQLESAQENIEKKSALLEKIAFQQSHLIRAPLSNIMGLTSILDKTTGDANTRNICKMILDSSVRLDDVIKSIVADTQR